MRTMSACCLTVYAKSPGLAMFSAISFQPSALSFGRSIAETGFSNEIVGYKVAELNIPDTELLWRSCGKLGFPFDERGKRGRRLITGTTARFPGAYKNLRSRNIRYTIATGNPTTLL